MQPSYRQPRSVRRAPTRATLAVRVAATVVAVSMAACGTPQPAADGTQPPAQGVVSARGADGSGPRTPEPAQDAVRPEPAVPPPASASSTAPAPGGRSAAAPSGPAAGAPVPPAGTASALPAAAPAPRLREVVIPAGTVLRLKLVDAVASDTSRPEEGLAASLDAPVSVGGEVAIPAGSSVRGTVLSAARSAKVKGRASVSFRFERLTAHGETYDVRTDRISRQAPPSRRKDATKIGIGAGAGALIGAIAGGGKGAAVGSAIGAGAGTGAVVATRGDEVRLSAGTVVTTRLREPLTIRVPLR